MSTRLSLHSNFGQQPQNADHAGSDNLKRNAWLALFAGSFLFWLLVAVMAWNLWN